MAEKKTISAREVVADIKVGVTDEQLMLKHGLSAKGLESLKKKLVTAGLLTEQDLDGKSPPTQVSGPAADKRVFAKNIADAVKGGLPDAEIVKRFGISAAKLPKVYESLIKASYLTQEDLNGRGNGEAFEQTVDLAPDVVGTVSQENPSPAAPVTATESTKDVLQDFVQRFNIPREELERLKTASIKDIKEFFEKHNIPWSEGMELAKALGLRAGDFAVEAAGKLKDKAKGIFSRFGGGGKDRTAKNQAPASPQDPPKQSRTATKCPNCHMPQNKPFEICPQCGVVVEKFLQRIEAESGTKKPASKSKIKIIAIAAGIVLVVVTLIGGLKSMIRGKKSVTASQTMKTVGGPEDKDSRADTSEIPFPVPPISDKDSAADILNKLIRFRSITEGGIAGSSISEPERVRVRELKKQIFGNSSLEEDTVFQAAWAEQSPCNCGNMLTNRLIRANRDYVTFWIRYGLTGDSQRMLEVQREIDAIKTEFQKKGCQDCITALNQFDESIGSSVSRGMWEKDLYSQVLQQRGAQIAKAQAALEDQKKKEKETEERRAQETQDRAWGQLPPDAQKISLGQAIEGPGTGYLGKIVSFDFVCADVGRDSGGYYLVLTTRRGTDIPATVVYFDPASCGNITVATRVAVAAVYKGKIYDVTVYKAVKVVIIPREPR